jgi:galactonate dehydratase
MKIVDMNLYTVPPRWLFLEVITDEGITGWGEPVVEGRASVVKTAVESLKRYIIGQNPMKIEDTWQAMYRTGFYRGGPEVMSAIAGIDQALWDIKGKFFSTPIYNLLGGRCRDRLRVYSWVGGDRPGDLENGVRALWNSGCTAVKMNGTSEMHYIDSYEKIDEVCKRVEEIRNTLGMKMDIAVDFHGRVHKTMAKVLAHALEPYHLMFIEEPVLSQNNEALREICNHTSTPIATGERMFSRWDFRPLLEDGYVDIIQPDLSHAGGISEVKKIASMAEAYDVAVAPHCPLGPIALAACVQVDACTPNVFIQEQSLGIHYNKNTDLLDYLKDPSVFKFKNGFIDIPEGPGLGIEIDVDKVKEAAKIGHDWSNPVWRNYDGTIAEW